MIRLYCNCISIQRFKCVASDFWHLLQLGVTLLGVCVLGFYVSVQARGSAAQTGLAPENFTTPLIPISRNDKWRKNSQSCQDLVNYTCPAGEFLFYFFHSEDVFIELKYFIPHCIILILFPSLRCALFHLSGPFTNSFRNFDVLPLPSFRLPIIFHLKYWNALFSIPTAYNIHPLIVVGVDGIRPDMLNPVITPALSMLAQCGVTTPSLVPTYPTNTFPNMYTIATVSIRLVLCEAFLFAKTNHFF